MPITPRLDIVKDGLSKMLTQDKGQTNLETFISIFLEEIQELEDAVVAVILDSDPRTARETRLPLLARVVGQPIGDLPPDVLRLAILGRQAANASNGSLPDLLKVFSALGIESSSVILLEPGFGSALFYSSQAISTPVRTALRGLLGASRGAGLNITFLAWTDDDYVIDSPAGVVFSDLSVQDSPHSFTDTLAPI